MDVKKTIDVRGKSVQERQQTAKKESMALRPGEVIEIIADDERMPAVAPKMAQAIGTIEVVNVEKKEDGLYHGYFRRIELLSLLDVEEEETVEIARVDGGVRITGELRERGLSPGLRVVVRKKRVSHIHSGPLIIEAGKKEILIPRGIAGKIWVGAKRLLDMEGGEKGVMTSLKDLNEEMKEGFRELGLQEGTDIHIRGHDTEKTYTFKIGGNNLVLGDGESAKILVSQKGKVMQANFLEGQGIVKKIMSGTELLERVGEQNILGEKIERLSVEEEKSHKDAGHFITLEMEGRSVLLGKGLAEKIWVRKVRQGIE